MSVTPHTILLKVREEFIKEAALEASKDITPGMLLEFTGSDVQPHSDDAALAEPIMVAVEAAIDGRGIDDDYDEDGETVMYHIPLPGDELYMLLAAGENASIGSKLTSDGAGCLEVGSAYQFRALEAVDNSLEYTPARIKVEVL
jgi:hypothetical protein